MKRSKVVLYNPMAVFYDMPLALLAIGSVLDPKRYEVIIVDARVDDQAHQRVVEAAKDAVCVGVTVLTGSPISDALTMGQKVKAAYPDLPIVWGGWHASLFPVETLEQEGTIDITVQAQGEETFRELVNYLENGADLSDVPGITFRRKNGEIQKNLGRPMQDMNNLTRVNYDLIDVEKYFVAKKQRQFDYISSTGCRFRCTFCADPFVYNRGWTALSPERMGEELGYWHKKHQFTDLNFQDETFFTKRQRVVQISEQFLERGIQSTWAGTMRADQGFRMQDEEFDICKKAGLRRVLVGVESGTQEMMDWLKKDIKLPHVLEVAERCKQRDIAVIFPFIIGFPDESDESFEASLKLAYQLSSMHPKFTTPIFYFKPYPGSQITQEVVEKGYQLPTTLEEWANFDYIGSSGPWVTDAKYRKVERFKFYNKLASRKNALLFKPLQQLAKLRCKTDFFAFPIEKVLSDRLRPQQQLS